jgi:GT2 family glycosyltransferase
MNLYPVQQAELSHEDMMETINGFHLAPLISVIMPVYNVDPKWLNKAVLSLQNQVYTRWELCAADDGSTRDDTLQCLKKHAANESRIRASFQEVNAGISAASNVSLAMATGEYIALMDNDDELSPDAFFWVVKEINEYPNADFIYSDECTIDENDPPNFIGFIYKPDYSPEFLKRCMYTAHLTIYKTELIRGVDGFDSRYDFAQDYDLALKASEKAVCIRHIERILYLWRAIEGSFAAGGKPGIEIAAAAAAAAMLKRRNIDGVIVPTSFGFPYRVTLETNPLISVIIPAEDSSRTISAVTWLIEKTAYPHFEVIIVCSNFIKKQLREISRYWNRVIFHEYNRPYNHADMCNMGIKQAKGKLYVFCRDILSFHQTTWLNYLVELLVANKEIGAVSPKVLRTDDTIQYAGIITDHTELTKVPYCTCHKDAIDPYWSRYNWTREVSVLSASCLAVKRDVYMQINGFDALHTPDKYSNADFSFKIRDAGFTCVYNNLSEVINRSHEWWDSWYNAHAFFARAYIQNRWDGYLQKDPYFTPSMKKAILGA